MTSTNKNLDAMNRIQGIDIERIEKDEFNLFWDCSDL